jgi:hypothetical protein
LPSHGAMNPDFTASVSITAAIGGNRAHYRPG